MTTPIVAVMFATLAAEMADPDRFRRGRTYVRQQAVVELAIEPGVARVDVQGSRARPYRVTVAARPVRRVAMAAAAAGRLNALVPRPDDLTISCTCPDWGAPCKHGVAALLALGDAMSADTDALSRWRQVDASVVAPDEPPEPVAVVVGGEPLDAWLGRGYDPAPPNPLAALATRVRARRDDDPTSVLVTAAIDDARATLARAFGRR